MPHVSRRPLLIVLVALLAFTGFLAVQRVLISREGKGEVAAAVPPTAEEIEMERLGRTHAALFDVYFPADRLPIPPAVQADARTVRDQTWRFFQRNAAIRESLAALNGKAGEGRFEGLAPEA